ncbi:MAG: putative toxin-antitoxin system toxin component, PIN family [Elainellaceae cyanobacterium]
MRYVFDTNVVVSALLFKQRKPAQAFRQALKTGELLLSLEVLSELSAVLGREKFNRYIHREEREEFLERLVAHAIFIEPNHVIQACRDPNDNKILELAVSGGADAIITGDQDLLILHPFHGILIITIETFLDSANSDAFSDDSVE